MQKVSGDPSLAKLQDLRKADVVNVIEYAKAYKKALERNEVR